MKTLDELFKNNREWADKIRRQDPEFFEKLSRQQSPNYLWIGCADSRVPANQIVGLLPGDIFVHRNIANMVVHTDLNCLSVMQFAVDILKVKHVIVVGHYGCSGVQAALRRTRVGLADNWLRHVQDVHEKHERTLRGLPQRERPPSTGCANSTSSSRCRTSARPASRATRGSAARSCTCTAGSTASPTAWRTIWARRSRIGRRAAAHLPGRARQAQRAATGLREVRLARRYAAPDSTDARVRQHVDDAASCTTAASPASTATRTLWRH